MVIFNDCSLCNNDVNLFALYVTKTDLSEELRKEGEICQKVLMQFSLFFQMKQ